MQQTSIVLLAAGLAAAQTLPQGPDAAPVRFPEE